jgi:hypothetical protein
MQYQVMGQQKFNYSTGLCMIEALLMKYLYADVPHSYTLDDIDAKSVVIKA